MQSLPALLIIEEDRASQDVVSEALRDAEIRILPSASLAEGEAELSEQSVEVILCDLGNPPGDGLAFLKRIRKAYPRVPIIAACETADSHVAIEAVKAGAFDFLSKPYLAPEVVRVVGEAVSCARKASAPVEIDPGDERNEDHDTLVGNSRAMLDVYKSLGRLSPTPVTVLIRGETGTGKELVARALYQYGHRSHRPFITVNCAAIPENLLESELFGHEKGAFTGAITQRIGKFEQANGATLFLDEIGDLDLALQAKLLRVLQEKRFQRVGGNEEISVDVRVIAATHRNLERMVGEGSFREDLFYRLNVASIRLPPLRDRTGDIPLLARFFVRRFSSELGLPAVEMTRGAIGRLESAPLPGNIRQLQNLVRKALIRSRGYPIDRKMVEELLLETEPPEASGGDSSGMGSYCESLVADAESGDREEIHRVAVEELERRLLASALRRSNGNITRTAEWLGLSRLTVREKAKKYGLLS